MNSTTSSHNSARGNWLAQFIKVDSFRPQGILLIGLVCTIGFSCTLYLWQVTRISGNIGFPLDDAWIHARFADNLATGNGFSYNPNISSSGSTSPLWVILLAATYRFTFGPVVSALSWGIALLFAASWVTYHLALLQGLSRIAAIATALLTAASARLIWGALSGMEVSLYVLLTLLALYWHIRHNPDTDSRSFLSTAMFALAALARPECYILFPIAWLDHVIVRRWPPGRLLRIFSLHLLLYVAISLPNWLFNYSVMESILPATFHAKVEGGLLDTIRSGQLSLLIETFTIRPLSFLVDFVVYLVENSAALFLPACIGWLVLLRRGSLNTRDAPRSDDEFLPQVATNSHIVPLTFLLAPVAISILSGWGELVGRYVAFLIPLYMILATAGLEIIARWVHDRVKYRNVLTAARRILFAAMVINAAAVLLYASSQYAWMVDNIQNMQVHMGGWIAQNIPADSLVALNDVGATTYFGKRKIIDTAGLTTPGIIPYLKQADQSRDQNILDYLRINQPDYLIVYPNWYPDLVTHTEFFTPIYSHTYSGAHIVALGGSTMVVYACSWSAE